MFVKGVPLLLLLLFENGAVMAMRPAAEVAAETNIDGENPAFMENYKGTGAGTANEYPVSREQISAHKSVTILSNRILADLKRSERLPRNDPHAKLAISVMWKEKLAAAKKTICSKHKLALECLQQPKGLGKRKWENISANNDKQGGYLDKLLGDMDKSRAVILSNALRQAANVKSFLNNRLGQPDVADLIELALTLTNVEKIYVKEVKDEGGKVFDMDGFLKEMSQKKEISNIPALAYLLRQLLRTSENSFERNTNFQRGEEADFKQDIMALKRFFHDPEENFTEAGYILAERNYVHLRHLFRELAKGEVLENDQALAQHGQTLANDEETASEDEEDQDPKDGDMPSLFKQLRAENTNIVWDWFWDYVGRPNRIANEIPAEMKNLHDLATLKLRIAEKKQPKQVMLWKLVQAIVLDVEFGRPYFYAQLLHEKLEKLSTTLWHNKWMIDYADIFSDITRIVLTRGPVDLADIADAYKRQTSLTLSQKLLTIARNHFPKDASDGHVTLMALKDFVEWAEKEDVPGLDNDDEQIPAVAAHHGPRNDQITEPTAPLATLNARGHFELQEQSMSGNIFNHDFTSSTVGQQRRLQDIYNSGDNQEPEQSQRRNQRRRLH